MTDANDLTLRNDVTGALIAGGHWHGGGNYEICATIAALCKAANERDALRAQVEKLVKALKFARVQLEEYEIEAGGEAYNDPDLNALIAEVEGGE